MKKLITLLLTMVIALSFFCGCKPPEKEEKLVFTPSLDTETAASFTIVGDMDNFEALVEVIKEFRKVYPNVVIEYQKLTNYSNEVELRLKNDSTIGCYMGGSESSAIDLYEYGYNTKGFGSAITHSIRDGRLYSIPLGLNVFGMVVNVDLLKKYDQKVPEKLSEFEAVCEVIKGEGLIPVQQQLSEGISRFMFEPLVWNTMATSDNVEQTLKLLDSGSKGSMEIMRTVFETYKRFNEKGYLDSEKNLSITNNYEKAILNFFKGDVAFMPANAVTLSGMKKRESKSAEFTENPFEYKFIYSPLSEDGYIAEQQVWSSLCASKYCDNKEIAVEFMKFLGCTDNLNLLAKVKGLPSVSNIIDDERYLFLNDVKGKIIHAWDYDIPYNTWNSVIGRLKEYALNNVDTIDEALSLIEQDVVRDR